MHEMIEETLCNYKEVYKLQGLKDLNRYNKYTTLFALGSSIAMIILVLLLDNLGVLEISDTFLSSSSNDIINLIAIILVYLIMMAVMMPTHEIIHYLLFPHKKTNDLYLIFRLPCWVGIFFNGFLSKRRFLIVWIAPFVLINIFILILNIFIADKIIIIAILHLNLVLSVFDIFMFFIVLRYVPAKAYIFGGHYTTDEIDIK